MSAHAVLFNGDHRVEIQDAPLFWQDRARSAPAIVPRSRLIDRGEFFELSGTPLTEIGFCSDARFADQSIIANCSASLIAPNLILSAAHCFEKNVVSRACQDYAVVFDYHLDQNTAKIPKSNIAFCEEVLYSHFDLNFTEDLVIFKLNRSIADRKPIPLHLSSLYENLELRMIGYPLGTPQKWVSYGEVKSIETHKHSFKHDLDTFSVNSGGPIFDANTGAQIGVLVRGTGTNYTPRLGSGCYDWSVGKEGDFAEGNTLLTLQATLDRLGVSYEAY